MSVIEAKACAKYPLALAALKGAVARLEAVFDGFEKLRSSTLSHDVCKASGEELVTLVGAALHLDNVLKTDIKADKERLSDLVMGK